MTDLLTVTNVDYSFSRHEHAELSAGIERIHELGGRLGSLAPIDLSHELLLVLGWFENVLAPHSVWEDHMLYDRIDERAGTTWATKLMRFEHDQLRRLAVSLASDRQKVLTMPTHDLLSDLRAHLYGFEALIKAHMEREEVFLFPLLEQ